MNAKERMTRAMRQEEIDYLPCSIYFNENLRVHGRKLNSCEDHCRLAMELGTDPFVSVGIKKSTHPEVKIETRVDRTNDKDYPILWQTWRTPAGDLTQAVKITEDITHWDRIHWNDHATSNIHKPLINSPEDVAKLGYLLHPATEADCRHSMAMNEKTFATAADFQAPTLLTYSQGLATLMFMIGAENLVLFAIDHPEEFKELARLVHVDAMRNLEVAKEMGVDILKRFGGYEMTNFFNPTIFDEVVAPYLKKEVERAHELGLLIYYRVVTGMEPLLDRIADIGFDCVEGGEPHLSNCSLSDWHDAFAGNVSSWTGVSTPVALGGDSPEKAREEVRQAVDVFGHQGFILGVTNSIRDHFPWENTLAMVDEWKRVR